MSEPAFPLIESISATVRALAGPWVNDDGQIYWTVSRTQFIDLQIAGECLPKTSHRRSTWTIDGTKRQRRRAIGRVKATGL